MFVKQISVFLENKKGRLASLTQALAQGGVDLITLSIADTTQFGILRCIVNKPDLAADIIRQNGFTVNITRVLAVEVEDKPGGMAAVLKILKDGDIGVEYLYSFVRRPAQCAWAVFKVEDDLLEKTVALLKENSIRILSEKDIT